MSLLRAHPLAVTVFALAACVSVYPQRLSGPLVLPPSDAPPAAPPPRTPAVTLQRDSDPVWVRQPGERGDRALPFYQKRERVPYGALVRTGAGGRAELLWSPDASTLALFDEGRVTLGDPELDEPLVRFHSLSRALLVLTPEDRVELVGGARLAGDALEPSGPILLESVGRSIVRVTNQSKRLCTLTFRAERMELGPGESIDLPVLSSGAGPAAEAVDPERFELRGLRVALHGNVERRDDGAGVSLTALEPARVAALGVQARLAEQETARFSGLSRVVPPNPIAPEPRQ